MFASMVSLGRYTLAFTSCSQQDQKQVQGLTLVQLAPTLRRAGVLGQKQ